MTVYISILLFFTGLLFGILAILIGLKRPLKTKKIGSYCTNCTEQYEWYQLIPVLSFFVNKGECPYCHHKINRCFPLLEIFSGLTYVVSYLLYGFSYELLIMIILIFLSINIFVSDFKYCIILDGPLLILSILVLLFKFLFFGFKVLMLSVLSGGLTFLFMFAIRYLGTKVFRQEALGGGDVKLAALFGFVMGLRLSIVSLILGAFLAFPYAIYSTIKGYDKMIPFGPFLILGLDVTFIFMKYIDNFLEIVFK